MDRFQLPYPEVFKLEHLLFAAKIFFDFPSGKVKFSSLYHIIFRFDFPVCRKHHGMFRNAIDKDEINIFSGSSDLYLNDSIVPQKEIQSVNPNI